MSDYDGIMICDGCGQEEWYICDGVYLCYNRDCKRSPQYKARNERADEMVYEISDGALLSMFEDMKDANYRGEIFLFSDKGSIYTELGQELVSLGYLENETFRFTGKMNHLLGLEDRP